MRTRLPIRSVLTALLAVLAPLAARSDAQDEHPHLTLQDALNPPVPAPGAIFDNSHVFPAFSGVSFQARLSYDSPVQPNPNVFWALLISAQQTPFPTSLQPPDFTPPLFTMPPFLMVTPVMPTLNAAGEAEQTLFVPAGLTALDAYIQAIVYDGPHVPPLRLSNGIKISVDVPDYSVRFSFMRNQEGAGEGVMDTSGYIDVSGDTLTTFKPLGPFAPPEYLPVEPPPPGVVQDLTDVFDEPYRFLDIVPNVPDEPVNPLARPMTRIVGTVNADTSTIPVLDTSFFPPRGRLLIQFGSGSLFADKIGTKSPDAEVVVYDGLTPTSFLNCQRAQVGSTGTVAGFGHVDGQVVVGDYTMATSSGARLRTRIALDADNRDMVHVVIPKTTYDGGEGVGTVVHDVDLYRYELLNTGVQGFGVMDRTTGRFRRIPDSEMVPALGPWYPMVCVAPDGRSIVVAQVSSGGPQGWDSNPDRLFAIRLDGLKWPASGSEAWQIGYQTVNGPTAPPTFQKNIRSRRFIMRSTAIVGPDPDNYVLFAGLADKWVKSAPTPGGGFETDAGFEAMYLREEVLVHDMIDCPLTPPGSAKATPSMPRGYLSPQFGKTGTNKDVKRFDPSVLVSPDRLQLLVIAGNRENEEDAFIIRNVGITAAGAVQKTLVNITGFPAARRLRPPQSGGHGQGRSAAFSKDGKKLVILSPDGIGSQARMDFLNIIATSGASYGQVTNVYANAAGNFKIPGVLANERIVTDLRWLDDQRVAFLQGRMPYSDPFGVTGGFTPGVDLFIYDQATDVMTNVTRTDGSADGFGAYGKILPSAVFGSPSGQYSYVMDSGVAGAGSDLPLGTPLRDLVGLEHATGASFRVSGVSGSLVPHLDLPAEECRAPYETASAMRWVEGDGVQAGMIYLTAHVKGGNGSDVLVGLNRDAPFVALQATFGAPAGSLLSNVKPSPYSGKVAFSRTAGATVNAADQHPFVVDLDHFLFERDVLPTWTLGGAPYGRVMDGSLHFVGPQGNAGESLVFSFGLVAQPTYGIAQISVPAIYPLASVSNTLAEPVPIVIPLIDTFLLGGDFRFYVPFAGPSTGD